MLSYKRRTLCCAILTSLSLSLASPRSVLSFPPFSFPSSTSVSSPDVPSPKLSDIHSASLCASQIYYFPSRLPACLSLCVLLYVCMYASVFFFF
ncbi:hypothetical protein GGS23DRAFT_546327, partial [Durotheca rogersii]|uniref:uncharacterized protein n=1 Tax=Durotheca rogersii TaxID=419775 RepID=UPI00221E68C3